MTGNNTPLNTVTFLYTLQGSNCNPTITENEMETRQTISAGLVQRISKLLQMIRTVDYNKK
jgi:hypothetical protein